MTKRSSSERPSVLATVASYTLISFAVPIMMLGAFTGWLRDDMLDTDRWGRMSLESLRDPTVKSVMAEVLGEIIGATQVQFTSRMAGELGVTPEQIQQGINKTETTTQAQLERALATPEVEKAWVDMNTNAHSELMAVVDNPEKQTSTLFTIDFRPFFVETAKQSGASTQIIELVPAEQTKLPIPRSTPIDYLVKALSFTKGIGGVLTPAGFIMLVASIAIMGKAWAGATIRAGVSLGLSVAALLVFKSINNSTTSELVTLADPRWATAMNSIVNNATESLYRRFWEQMVFGILLTVIGGAGWFMAWKANR